MDNIKLIVIISNSDDAEKCINIVNMVKKAVSKYVNVDILIANVEESSGGISVNGEDVIPCNQEDEAIEKVIERIAASIEGACRNGIIAAAGVFQFMETTM